MLVEYQIKYCGGNFWEIFYELRTEIEIQKLGYLLDFLRLLIAHIFWLLILSGRGQEHRLNPPNNGDDNDSDDNESDDNDNDNVLYFIENKIFKKKQPISTLDMGQTK